MDLCLIICVSIEGPPSLSEHSDVCYLKEPLILHYKPLN